MTRFSGPATADPLPGLVDDFGIQGPRITTAGHIAVVVIGLVFFWLNENFTMSGDSATYADYALQGKFDEITVHFGYYVALWALERTVGAWFGIPIHELVAHINVVCGALTLPIVLSLARHVLRDTRYALLATAFFVVSGRTVLNASSGEIYMLQTLLVFGSWLLYIRDRVAWAAVVAGLAMYISPLSLFAYLFFPAYDQARLARVDGKRLLQMLAIGFAVYLPFLVFHGREMLFGLRGLLMIPSSLPALPSTMLVNFVTFQVKHYSALLLLGIPLLWAWKREKVLIGLTLAVFIPHLAIILKLTSEDNVFILNTDLLFCCCLAAGARELARLMRGVGVAVVAAILVAHVGLMAKTDMFFPDDNRRGEAAELTMIGRTYLDGKSASLVTDWGLSQAITFFARPSFRGTLMEDPLQQQMIDATAATVLTEPLRARDIYVLEMWAAGGLARLLRSEEQLAAIKDQLSFRTWARAKAGLDCGEMIYRGIYELYRCRRTPAAFPAKT